MKLILLSGPSRCGKTTTINVVFHKLCGGDKHSRNVLFYKPINDYIYKDFEAIIKYNNRKVAFFSMGDCKGECINAIIKFAGADVLIMALNNHFVPLLTKQNENYYKDFPAHVLIKSKKFFDSKWVQTIIDAI